jgi:hypothetical protein
MKNISIYIILFVSLLASSCSERLDEINLDPNRLEADQAVPGPLFAKSVSQSVHKDNFSQLLELIADFGPMAHYFATLYPTAFAADSYYDLNEWTKFGFWANYWSSVGLANDVLALTGPDGEFENANNNAMARIWKVYLLSRLSDAYGDIPYTEGGLSSQGLINPEYDLQNDSYDDMFIQLDQAIEDLEEDVPGKFTTQDIVYNGDIALWTKFAATLKLRIALRIRYVEPDNSKTKAEEALATGIFSSNADNAQELSGDNHGKFGSPLYQITTNLFSYSQSFKASFSLVEFLKGNHNYRDGASTSGIDPRLNTLISDNASGEKIGIMNGHTAEYYDLHPEFADQGSWFLYHTYEYEPATILSFTEAKFLEAEAALLNYSGVSGTASQLYKEGIDASMEFLGVDPSTFSNDEQSLFDALADDEAKLERIIYQKWIGLFPDAHEAWAEQRRTGYPVIVKRTGADFEQGITNGTIPNRIPYPAGELNTNATQVNIARERQGGDGMLVKLWWDKKTLQDSWE